MSHKEALLLGKQIGIWLYRLCRCEKTFLRVEDPISRLIKKAFDNKIDEKDVADIVKKSLENFGMIVTETLNSITWPPSYLKKIITIEGIEHFHHAFSYGKGLVIFSAHYANWEILSGIPLYFEGLNITAIMQDIPLPRFNQFLRKLRGSNIKELYSLNKHIAFNASMKTLCKGGVIATVIDHCFKGSRNIPVPFFGKPALTPSGAAFLAHHTGAPCLPAFAIRETDDLTKHLVKIYPPIFPNPEYDYETNAICMLSEYRKSLEAHIRLDPGQFLWTYDPWNYSQSRT